MKATIEEAKVYLRDVLGKLDAIEFIEPADDDLVEEEYQGNASNTTLSERAKKFHNISDDDWLALTDEEKTGYIGKLPPVKPKEGETNKDEGEQEENPPNPRQRAAIQHRDRIHECHTLIRARNASLPKKQLDNENTIPPHPDRSPQELVGGGNLVSSRNNVMGVIREGIQKFDCRICKEISRVCDDNASFLDGFVKTTDLDKWMIKTTSMVYNQMDIGERHFQTDEVLCEHVLLLKIIQEYPFSSYKHNEDDCPDCDDDEEEVKRIAADLSLEDINGKLKELKVTREGYRDKVRKLDDELYSEPESEKKRKEALRKQINELYDKMDDIYVEIHAYTQAKTLKITQAALADEVVDDKKEEKKALNPDEVLEKYRRTTKDKDYPY